MADFDLGFESLENSSDSSSRQIFFGIHSYFILKYMLCVFIRIASSKRFWWVHSTYHYLKKDRNNIPKLFPFASRPGALINPQWLELPMSRTSSLVPQMFELLKFDCRLQVEKKKTHSRAFEITITKTAYSNILKTLQSRRQFSDKKKLIFFKFILKI